MKHYTKILPAAALCFSGFTFAQPEANIEDLSWMTGTWQTALGPNTLEENWVKPNGDSIASLVRMYGPEGISMWEVITIEEQDGTLAMTVQQWDSGFESRTEAAQEFILAEIGEQRVMFNAVTEGGMKTLGYNRSGDSFNIEMTLPAGNTVNAELHAAE